MKDTYVVPLALDKTTLTKDAFIDNLVTAINASGGLRIVEDEVPSDIQPGTQVSAEDIVLALPSNRDAPYDNEWIEVIEDEPLKSVVFNDYDILGFKYIDDADFHITKPEYVEQEQ